MTTGLENLDAALEELIYLDDRPPMRVAQWRRIVRALREVVEERTRQERIGLARRAEGVDWRSCADPEMDDGDFARFAVLGEEVGEVARATLEAAYGSGSQAVIEEWERRLRKELVEVAAVSVAWIEAIDARNAT